MFGTPQPRSGWWWGAGESGVAPLPLGAWLVTLEHRGPPAAVGGAGVDFLPSREKARGQATGALGPVLGAQDSPRPHPAWASQPKDLPLPKTQPHFTGGSRNVTSDYTATANNVEQPRPVTVDMGP